MTNRRFETALAADAEALEARLAAALSDEGEGHGAEKRLVAAMRHAALGGGKRLRPFLVMETSRLFDVPAERALTRPVMLSSTASTDRGAQFSHSAAMR